MPGGGIEQLIDDLLSLIVSHLTLEEAARTCVLSSRWDKLWNAVPCLSFDTLDRRAVAERLSSNYVQKVNRVLERRGTPAFTLNSLEFHHDLLSTHRPHVDDWFRYAIANKVRNFNLDLRGKDFDEPHTLQVAEWCKAPSALTNFKWLKTMKLKHIPLTKEFVEFVLSNCRLLEKLVLVSVSDEKWSGLEISGSSLVLQHLKIVCFNEKFELISLCAPNLTSFNYHGLRLVLGMLDVPRLLSLRLGSEFETLGGELESMQPPIVDFLYPFWKYLPQLEKLKLRYSAKCHTLKTCKGLPSLLKLRHLTLLVSHGRAGHEFKGLIALLKKCPVLQMLKLNACCVTSLITLDVLNENQPKLISRPPHYFECLREVRINGATRRTLDLKLTGKIIERSPKLEKLIMKPVSHHEIAFIKMAASLIKRASAGSPAIIIEEY